jgi:predicted nucleic acid-binding protein
MKLVLDTNVYSDFAEGLKEVVDVIAGNSEALHIPAVVIGELQYGFLKGSRWQFNEEKLVQFINLFDVAVIPVDQTVVRKYAEIYLELSAKGTKIPINDIWIAACCLVAGGTLFTRDRYFEHIDRLDKIIIGGK